MEIVLEEARREIRNEMKSGETKVDNTTMEVATDLRQALSLRHLQGAFWVFLLGLLAALFSFLIENGTGRSKMEA